MGLLRRITRIVGFGSGALLVVAGIALALSGELRENARWWVSLARIAMKINLDEADVPAYTLPDPLVHPDGRPVSGRDDWYSARREALLALFRDEIYGHAPPPLANVDWTEKRTAGALAGVAERCEVSIALAEDEGAPRLGLLLHLPANTKAPVPVFLGLNFWGNHAIHPDPTIALARSWLPDAPERGIANHHATDAARGRSASRWPLERILARGYGVATAYYGDIEPDDRALRELGVRAFHTVDAPSERAWGAIAGWAWGLSRALDYLEQAEGVDPNRVVVLGHSRLGKAALWAAAQDTRFAAAISNDSGCMGAAISRRRFGETVAFINMLFPHWFPEAFDRYSNDEDALPVDQHMLLALIAPRPLYVASALEDGWADPRGEFESTRESSRVYRWLGLDGLVGDEMPAVDEPLRGHVSYHVRAGEHDLSPVDWGHFLDFADRIFARNAPGASQ